MILQTFKTLWGHTGSVEAAAVLAKAANFSGLEAPAKHADKDYLAALESALNNHGLEWIQEVCTAGSYVPRRQASVSEHLADLEAQILMGKTLQPKFINVMGGCDAWPIATSVEFFKAAMDIADKHGVLCSFETHRGRSFFSPWNTAAVLQQLPDIRITCDFSHWVVVSERLMDSEWDVIELAAQHAHHVHSRVGYDQGPQVPHPGAPEYAEALASHQRCWEEIWSAQMSRGYTETTMTPEFGPDGYLHHLPFTNAPIADLWDLNCWIGATEQKHFVAWSQAAAQQQEVRHA
ncbi:sugar phosphate isomerase/epimerase [Halieaceae bacterium IMCC14734]|uniref:Sugar phosphate isomerase/epimerase n=1 Tax=Candidatus Litorirhabdus singularis TaxID=2518993 RepID=A0ABT3TG98_9GAMM|nr:TIM barrel protein [Candidatus Litorirhabdus singularis]MCX2980791.1 sugar phosphate isomerase/epimerase [Candidatus Litorirhabdus singularis]